MQGQRAARQKPGASSQKLRCFCKSHQCGIQYDPDAALYGVLVEARVHRAHQDADVLAELHIRAEKEQREALAAHEAAMLRSLEALNLETQPPPTPSSEIKEGNKLAAIKQTISQISEVQDSFQAMMNTAHLIGNAPLTLVPPQVIKDALSRLCDVRSQAAQQHRQLMYPEKGAYHKQDSVRTLLAQTKQEYQKLRDLLVCYETSWETAERRQEAEHEAFLARGGTTFDSGSHYVKNFAGVKPVLQLVILMVVSCSIVLGLPRRGCRWLFCMVEYIIQTAVIRTCKFFEMETPAYFTNLLAGFPRDIRTATQHFNVESKSTVFAACPRCHATYAPQIVNGTSTYPQRCTSREYGSRCGELLVRPKSIRGHQIFIPIKPYVSFDMKDWMASFLSRRGNEEKMDAAWNRMADSPDGILRDIFQGSVIREFKGVDKGTHFCHSGGTNAGRYLFSLGADFFNPLRNLTAGKKVSIGVIALVCLNLPIEERYLPENMFLAGIIPGPHEPTLCAINHYMQPLIDVLLLFWKGILFSKTALYATGRLIFCALIAVICDLPAARKFGGFAGHRHEYFCSTCWCNKTQHTYNDFDYPSWKRRTNEECRTYAETFRSATSAKAASSSFSRTGLRWSELLRLPYFDPTKMLVVDPMHNLFLGLIKEHFQNILGYRPKSRDWLSDDAPVIHIHIPQIESNPLPPGKSERASVRRLISILSAPLCITEENTLNDLILKLGGPKSTIHVSAFVYVSRGLNCIKQTVDFDGRDKTTSAPRLKKKDLAKFLVSWRQQQQETEIGDSLDEMRGRIFTEKEMEELWGDLERVVKPSWVSSVPQTISSICPKLKSDQWRTVGSLYLPVTLVRLWSGLNPQHEQHKERQQLLHLTMLLCSAIAIATSRITSEAHSKQFLAQMTEYRRELNCLFPAYECHPNHHIAFHITELLVMYGPVHGWWTFPFERMIGMLQRIRTNYKEGEYEATIARSWSRSSNFRAFFSKTTCPRAFTFCYGIFKTLVQPQARNSLSLNPAVDIDVVLDSEDLDVDDTLASEEISDDIRAAFVRALPAGTDIPTKGNILNRITHQGISYSTSAIHEGNSGILRRGSDVPFSIEKIVEIPEHQLQRSWLVVRRYKTSQVEDDPYLRYPLLRAKMWAPELESMLEVIPMSDVDSHFAKCAITWQEEEVVVIVSLSRIHEVE